MSFERKEVVATTAYLEQQIGACWRRDSVLGHYSYTYNHTRTLFFVNSRGTARSEKQLSNSANVLYGLSELLLDETFQHLLVIHLDEAYTPLSKPISSSLRSSIP